MRPACRGRWDGVGIPGDAPVAGVARVLATGTAETDRPEKGAMRAVLRHRRTQVTVPVVRRTHGASGPSRCRDPAFAESRDPLSRKVPDSPGSGTAPTSLQAPVPSRLPHNRTPHCGHPNDLLSTRFGFQRSNSSSTTRRNPFTSSRLASSSSFSQIFGSSNRTMGSGHGFTSWRYLP